MRYIAEEKVIFEKKIQKNFYSALLLKKEDSTINLELEKSRKDTISMYQTMSSTSRMAFFFVNLILIEKISTLSYEQENNFISSESRIQTELRTLTQSLSLILTKANATD